MVEQSVTLGTTVKYNPHLWGKEELRAIFVARTRELAEVVHSISDTPVGKVPQHLLITGARGMGKSTLLNRVALAVQDDADLSKLWLPLLMPEEQYTISTLAELWLNILGVLADSWEQQGANPIELAQLDLEVARIRTLELSEQEAAALLLLTNVIKQSGKRLLLLIDSTDQLFGNLSTDQTRGAGLATGSTQLWRLRNTLTHCPELFWLGASYQALEVSQHYGDAFHDFFELIELRPLTLEEMRDAMLALARTFGISSHPAGDAAAEEMQRNLDARPERLKTLRAITGGNPRTTVIIYDLFAAGWKEDLHSDLKALLDIMTPLYKARMENLAEQPRKILAHIMEQWSPVALRELAKVSGIASTTLSSQLKRLEQEGYIEKAKLPATKRNSYQVSERLFNIWYLMRYTSRWVRQKLSWLIEFMRIWYSVDELRDLTQSRAQVHRLHGYPEAEMAYQQAQTINPQDPYPCVNLARLALQTGQKQNALDLYRQTVQLAAKKHETEGGIVCQELLLQANLELNNRDAANSALENLAQAASSGNNLALFKLREQAGEAAAIGLGLALSELMAGSRYADFLQPMTLALRAAADVPDALEGVAAEIKAIAAEVLADILAYRNGKRSA